MIFVEFNGLPGCGKSTVAESLTLELRERGYDVLTYNNFHERMPRKIAKAVPYIVSNWDINELCELNAISSTVKGNSLKTKINRIAVAEQICFNYRKYAKCNGICIVDQGIIQALISIAYINTIKDNYIYTKRCLDLLLRYKLNIYVVNAVSCSENARERIRIRNFSDGSRFNYIHDDQLLIEMLDMQLESIKLIRDCVKNGDFISIDIDMNNSIKDNSQRLRKWIEDNDCNKRTI